MMNQILELTNNVRTINQGALWLYFSVFLLVGFSVHANPQSYILPDLGRMARCLGFAIWVWATGAIVIGVTIWIQRRGLGGLPGRPDWWTVPCMTLGNTLLALGALLLLRIMSLARFGNDIWHGLIMVNAAYVAWAIFWIAHG